MGKMGEIRERLKLATTRPWKVDVSENFGNDWPITTGTASKDGKVYHVCTDGVRGSSLTGDSKSDAEFIAKAPEDIEYLLKTAELLYECIVELSYVHSVENCDSGLCTSAKGEELVEQGMKLLGVEDLSKETLSEERL